MGFRGPGGHPRKVSSQQTRPELRSSTTGTQHHIGVRASQVHELVRTKGRCGQEPLAQRGEHSGAGCRARPIEDSWGSEGQSPNCQEKSDSEAWLCTDNEGSSRFPPSTPYNSTLARGPTAQPHRCGIPLPDAAMALNMVSVPTSSSVKT